MNFLNKILLSVFLSLFCFCSIAVVGQAYSADHLILQDLDTQNNLATICQDDGSLCSDVEVVSFDDLDSDQKDQVIEMIASSAMDGSSYSSTTDLDKFSNFLSHSDEISYSSKSADYIANYAMRAGVAIVLGSAAVFITGAALGIATGHKALLVIQPFKTILSGSMLAGAAGVSLVSVGVALLSLDL